MKFLMLFIVLLIETSVYAKGRPRAKTDVLTAQEVVNEIEVVLQSVQDGTATIHDSSCANPSFVKQSDYLKATVNSADFYIVTIETVINGKTYPPSYCEKRTDTSNGFKMIECSSTEKSPATSPAQVLSFYMSYILEGSSYGVHTCPELSQTN